MSILSDLFKRLGLKYEDLSDVRIDPQTGLGERETFKRMEETLREEMTIDKIIEFLKAELDRFQVEFANNENSVEKDFLLKAQMRNYTALLFFIESPKLAKEKLEAYLSKVAIK